MGSDRWRFALTSSSVAGIQYLTMSDGRQPRSKAAVECAWNDGRRSRRSDSSLDEASDGFSMMAKLSGTLFWLKGW
jgi:hypothetical protein